MIRINLIPHRAQFRQKQILEYITVFVASVMMVLLMVAAVNFWSSQDLNAFQQEKANLTTRNAVLSKKIGELRNLASLREEVEGKLQIVDELQAGRFRSLITLNAISEAIPQNIWINTLEDKAGNMSVTGFGESSKAVANFMRALEVSEMFDGVTLAVDQSAIVGGVEVRKFELSFRRRTLAERSGAGAK